LTDGGEFFLVFFLVPLESGHLGFQVHNLGGQLLDLMVVLALQGTNCHRVAGARGLGHSDLRRRVVHIQILGDGCHNNYTRRCARRALVVGRRLLNSVHLGPTESLDNLAGKRVHKQVRFCLGRFNTDEDAGDDAILCQSAFCFNGLDRASDRDFNLLVLVVLVDRGKDKKHPGTYLERV
jgi:hypothetical protein